MGNGHKVLKTSRRLVGSLTKETTICILTQFNTREKYPELHLVKRSQSAYLLSNQASRIEFHLGIIKVQEIPRSRHMLTATIGKQAANSRMWEIQQDNFFNKWMKENKKKKKRWGNNYEGKDKLNKGNVFGLWLKWLILSWPISQ